MFFLIIWTNTSRLILIASELESLAEKVRKSRELFGMSLQGTMEEDHGGTNINVSLPFTSWEGFGGECQRIGGHYSLA